MNRVVLVFLFVCALSSGFANKVDVFLSKSNFQVGDKLMLNFEVTANKNSKIIFPSFENYITPLELINTDTLKIFPLGRKAVYQQSISAIAWDSTKIILPQMPIIIIENSNIDTIFTKTISLNVSMIKADTLGDIKDIFPPDNEQITLKEKTINIIHKFWWLCIPILLFVLIYFVNKIKTIKRRPSNLIIPKGMKPIIWCEKELKLAEKKNANEKNYYKRVADILKLYLEHKFHQPILSYTTSEIKQFLENNYLNHTLNDEIIEFLRESDLVKFSNQKPKEKNQSIADSILNIIKKIENDVVE